MKKILFLLSVVLPLMFLQFTNPQKPKEYKSWGPQSKLSTVLHELGEPRPKHYLSGITDEMIKQGEEMVKNGKTTSGSRSSGYISKFYTCTSCHNLQQEDPDLRSSDPDARLSYVKSRGIPFLQATTFFGMVNRESWYNDDYQIKYGSLALLAHDSLREAIQLCAEVCSQGRRLEDWELNAILAYVWTLEYTLADLRLSASDLENLNKERKDASNHEALRKWLKTFYAKKSPATFVDAPPDKHAGYAGIEGRPEVGKDIYELSCQNCHHANGESNLVLDDATYTFRKFRRNFAKENHFSIYKIVRYGTHPVLGHKPYMPHYTLQRMSHQQVEDLRAYIEQQAS